MKIGFLGGTFDPIHNGHIGLALEIAEKKGLDEVLFCPASQSPHKHSAPTAPIYRLEMVRLAIEKIPGFRLLAWEASRPGPSYTIDTLRHLEGSDELHLLLGDDCVERFADWKEAAEILRIAPPYMGTRRRTPPVFAQGMDPLMVQALKEGVVKTTLLEISATDIRHRLENQLYCGHLVPPEVLAYIQIQGIYY